MKNFLPTFSSCVCDDNHKNYIRRSLPFPWPHSLLCQPLRWMLFRVPLRSKVKARKPVLLCWNYFKGVLFFAFSFMLQLSVHSSQARIIVTKSNANRSELFVISTSHFIHIIIKLWCSLWGPFGSLNSAESCVLTSQNFLLVQTRSQRFRLFRRLDRVDTSLSLTYILRSYDSTSQVSWRFHLLVIFCCRAKCS